MEHYKNKAYAYMLPRRAV